MTQRRFRIYAGRAQDRFMKSRAKVQFMAGGYGNGKTSAVCIKALDIGRQYPGANILMARSTYPKLNDTLRKEFIKWCPKEWVKSFPMSNNGSNTCTLDNGTQFNFRYVSQEGTGKGEAVSNQLSATYDLIVVDQVEDPQITHKDFLDLVGRLRGSTRYVGTDSSMPETGPRWMMLTANPTRNWVYKQLVAPLHRYAETGYIDDKLICERDPIADVPITVDGRPNVLIELHEATTYDNAENLGPDTIKLLEATYRGVMRDRYILGKWGAFEGLVYPDYDPAIHSLPQDEMRDYLLWLVRNGYEVSWQEGYDYGLAVPSCYLLAFIDHEHNIMVCDGLYQAEMKIEDQVDHIQEIRRSWGCTNKMIHADPSIFRRGPVSAKLVGRSTADIIWNHGSGVMMVRGNNDIANGIIKVQALMNTVAMHPHPITHKMGAPRLYFARELEFIDDEFTSFMWSQDSKGEREDEPRDRNDHAMDCLRYLLSRQPVPSRKPVTRPTSPPAYMSWHERDIAATNKDARYGYAA